MDGRKNGTNFVAILTFGDKQRRNVGWKVNCLKGKRLNVPPLEPRDFRMDDFDIYLIGMGLMLFEVPVSIGCQNDYFMSFIKIGNGIGKI